MALVPAVGVQGSSFCHILLKIGWARVAAVAVGWPTQIPHIYDPDTKGTGP
jgi:hypothetical protein